MLGNNDSGDKSSEHNFNKQTNFTNVLEDSNLNYTIRNNTGQSEPNEEYNQLDSLGKDLKIEMIEENKIVHNSKISQNASGSVPGNSLNESKILKKINLEDDNKALNDCSNESNQQPSENDLMAIKHAADNNNIKIKRVIFDPALLKLLFKTAHADALRSGLAFSTSKPWVRHDEHYHIDFDISCKSK